MILLKITKLKNCKMMKTTIQIMEIIQLQRKIKLKIMKKIILVKTSLKEKEIIIRQKNMGKMSIKDQLYIQKS